MYTLLMSTWLSVIVPYVYEKQGVHTVGKDDVARYVRLRDSISLISREFPWISWMIFAFELQIR